MSKVAQRNTPNLYRQWQFIRQCRNSEDKKTLWLPSLSLILAVVIHLLVIVQFAKPIRPNIITSPQEISFEVEWVSPAVADEVPQEATPEPSTPTPPIVSQKEAPIIPPKAEPKPTPKPKLDAPKKTPAKQVQAQHPISPKTTSIANMDSTQFNTPKALQMQMRQDYLSHIFAIIKTHKTYPYSARRRHIEGDIHVIFSITQDGQIRNIKMTGEHASLRHASIAAIEASTPLPKPPQAIFQTLQANFIMQYRLKR